MKKSQIHLLTGLTAFLLLASSVNAQRGRENNGGGRQPNAGGGRSFQNAPQRMGGDRPNSTFQRRDANPGQDVQRNREITTRPFGQDQRTPATGQRGPVTRQPGQEFGQRKGGVDRQRDPIVTSRPDHNNFNRGNDGRFGYNNYSRNNYNRGSGFRPTPVIRRPYFAPPRYTVGVPYYGQRFNRLNYPYTTIGWHGYNYNYYGGIFYRPFGSYFQVVAPPIGIRISLLPLGYRSIYVGSMPYYYYNGIFYNRYHDNEYEVVDPPLGAKLPELPAGAKLVTINGQHYYELDGTYYAEEYNSKDEVLYTVVGVHGVLNEAEAAKVNPGTDDDSGTFVKTLPPDCKTVTINGQQLFVSPNDVYYQQVTADDGTISYQVVGNGSQSFN